MLRALNSLWPFKKGYSRKENCWENFIDYHSHILPGVDDGVQTMDEALRILTGYEALGIKEVWLTPHIMEDIPNTTDFLREQFEALKIAYRGKVRLHLASENMLDYLFEERLEKNDLLPIGLNGNHLLVETSCFHPPMDLYGTLKRIKAKGYHPILAHPERYVYMDEAKYRKLKGTGVKFQLNLFSLTGSYGTEIKKKSKKLLSLGMYDVAGSDVHHLSVLGETSNIRIPAAAVWGEIISNRI